MAGGSQRRPAMAQQKSTIADDLIVGGPAIARELGMPDRQFYYLAANGRLGELGVEARPENLRRLAREIARPPRARQPIRDCSLIAMRDRLLAPAPSSIAFSKARSNETVRKMNLHMQKPPQRDESWGGSKLDQLGGVIEEKMRPRPHRVKLHRQRSPPLTSRSPRSTNASGPPTTPSRGRPISCARRTKRSPRPTR